jgi:hypothetical protein
VGADTKTAAAKQSRLAVFRGEHVNGVLKVIEDWTVSKPLPPVSLTMSPL